MDLLRSLEFIPGNRRDMLEKARDFDADVLVADLEDSVPPAEKAAAVDLVAELGPTLAGRGQKIAVRLNSLDTGLTGSEIDAVLGPHIYAISIGKVDSPSHIQQCHNLLNAAEVRLGIDPGTVKIIPWIESAAAVMDARTIATASPRVVALAFGAEDYTNDMGIQRTDQGDEMRFPRSLVPLAARASGIVALDTPYVRFRDAEGLALEAQDAAALGYKGKFAIHPAQLDTINRVFSPSDSDIEYARRVLAAWDEAEAGGRGALALDGRMVDVPVVKRARSLLELVREIDTRR